MSNRIGCKILPCETRWVTKRRSERWPPNCTHWCLSTVILVLKNLNIVFWWSKSCNLLNIKSFRVLCLDHKGNFIFIHSFKNHYSAWLQLCLLNALYDNQIVFFSVVIFFYEFFIISIMLMKLLVTLFTQVSALRYIEFSTEKCVSDRSINDMADWIHDFIGNQL